jgi:hypothetical protein
MREAESNMAVRVAVLVRGSRPGVVELRLYDRILDFSPRRIEIRVSGA